MRTTAEICQTNCIQFYSDTGIIPLERMRNGLRPHDRITRAVQFKFTIDDLRTFVEKRFDSLRGCPLEKEHIVRLDVCLMKRP